MMGEGNKVQGVVDIVGRDGEIAAVRRFLDGDEARALLLEGPAGIGKTSLWHFALAAATSQGHEILRYRAVGSEVRLSFAGLADLLEGVTEVLAELPPSQREALEVALLHRPPPAGGVDVRATGAAVLGILRLLSSRAPVIVAVDDLQWLDVASARALEFAFRRLGQEPVGVLATLRGDFELDPPFDLDATALPCARIEVGPMSLGAVQRLLRMHLGYRPPRPLLVRLHEASGGNPFYALALGRTLAAEPSDPAPGEPLPTPPSVAGIVERRLRLLPEECVDALLSLAARGQSRVPLEDDLLPAVENGVLESRGGLTWFSHPLFAAAVYGAASPARRREAHGRLAAAATGAEERARHLALAASEPNEATAAVVAVAADEAMRRGATSEAVELYERAVALSTTVDPDLLAERVRGAAEANRRAGNEDGARAVARAGLARIPAGRARARLLVWLADAEGTVRAADDAIEAAGADAALLAASLCARSEALQIADDVDGALADARRALAAARTAGDRSLVVRALSHVGHLEVMTGTRAGRERLEEALALQDPADPATLLHGPATALAIVRLWHDDLDGARAALAEQMRRATEIGDERTRASILQRLARVELWSGNLEHALALADELVELKEGEGWDDPVAGLWVRALVLAQLGKLGAAAADVERARELAASQGDPDHFHVVFANGFLAVAAGDHDAAAAQLERLPGLVEATGVREPGVCPYHADELESLVRAGRLERAAARVEVVEREAERLGRPRLRVAAARGRGLLSEAEGRRDAAIESFERAVSASRSLPVPFEQARALLDLGGALRRARRQSEARQALTAAHDGFAVIGADPWTAQALEELGQLGGRPRTEALTPAEARVAALAAEGRSTKAIASELVVSAKTVEKQLTSIYAKVGVRSKAELAARFADQ